MSHRSTPCKGCKNPTENTSYPGYCEFCIRSGLNTRPTPKPGVVTAPDLDAAAKNPDGTYNGFKALSWLSEALHPGQGFTVDEVESVWEEVKKRKEQNP